jgi:hypothetical protein
MFEVIVTRHWTGSQGGWRDCYVLRGTVEESSVLGIGLYRKSNYTMLINTWNCPGTCFGKHQAHVDYMGFPRHHVALAFLVHPYLSQNVPKPQQGIVSVCPVSPGLKVSKLLQTWWPKLQMTVPFVKVHSRLQYAKRTWAHSWPCDNPETQFTATWTLPLFLAVLTNLT